MARWDLSKTKTQNAFLFVGGFIGVIYETVVEQIDRPYLLFLFGGMMGLTRFNQKDPSGPADKDESR